MLSTCCFFILFTNLFCSCFQLIIQEETGICEVVDPWAGSYAMEALTNEIYQGAKAIVEEVEKQGGMTKSVVTGYPKLKIEESATRRQADIDSGKEVIVGVNKFRLEKEDELDVRKIDNSKVLASQISKLVKLRASRDNAKSERDAVEVGGWRSRR